VYDWVDTMADHLYTELQTPAVPYSFKQIDPGLAFNEYEHEIDSRDRQERVTQQRKDLESGKIVNLCGLSFEEAKHYGQIQYQLLIQTLKERRKCGRCGVAYTEADNFQWRCRKHAKPWFNEFEHTPRFECCGVERVDFPSSAQSMKQRGCVRCDHIDNSHPALYNIYRIPCILVDAGIVKLPNQAHTPNIFKKVEEENPLESHYVLVRDDQQ